MGEQDHEPQLALLDLGFSAPPSPSLRGTQEAVAAVFASWQAATGRTGTRLDAKRASKIRSALALYPLEDVLDAVRGWQNDSFYCGENDRGRVYNEITMLLRDAEHVERFRDMARAPKTIDRGRKAARKRGHEVRRAFAMGEME